MVTKNVNIVANLIRSKTRGKMVPAGLLAEEIDALYEKETELLRPVDVDGSWPEWITEGRTALAVKDSHDHFDCTADRTELTLENKKLKTIAHYLGECLIDSGCVEEEDIEILDIAVIPGWGPMTAREALNGEVQDHS